MIDEGYFNGYLEGFEFDLNLEKPLSLDIVFE